MTRSLKKKKVLNGRDDPLVPKSMVDAFEEEMNKAKVKTWTVTNYGYAKHRFTAPREAPQMPIGGFHESAQRKSWVQAFDQLRDSLQIEEPAGEVKSIIAKI